MCLYWKSINASRWSKRKYDVDSGGLKSLWKNGWQHKLQNVVEAWIQMSCASLLEVYA
jgi:hypothetical protein